MRYNNREGQAFLALVLVIGGILVTAGIVLAIVVASSVNSTYGYQASQNAEAIATAGAEDALMELNRQGGSFSALSTVGYGIAAAIPSVAVTQNSPAAGEVTITSSATVSQRTRNVRVIAAEDATTGRITIISWQEY